MQENSTSLKNSYVPKQTVLPRWRGFNLLGMFASADSKYGTNRPQNHNTDDDYKMIADFGFDFIRIPCSYRLWSSVDDPSKINYEALEKLDNMIENCLKNGLHANLCMHRLPGYCINNDEKIPEKGNLFTDDELLVAASEQWKMLADRYKNISAEKLSFNVVNEPERYVTMEQYQKLIDAVLERVHKITPDRLFIIDGMHCGDHIPVFSMFENIDKKCAYSCRGYTPRGLTHYTVFPEYNTTPLTWPGAYEFGKPVDVKRLEQVYDLWAFAAERLGVGVHCGEMGCFKNTPHEIALAWLDDVLRILTERNIGFAMWQFNGPFGVADSGRSDVEYKKIGNRLIDKKMLDIMMKY